MLINFPAMTPDMIYAAFLNYLIEHGFCQSVPFEAAQDFHGLEFHKTSGLPQVEPEPVVIDVQRSSGLVGILYFKFISGHRARILVPGIPDQLHMQLGIGAAWITKCPNLLADNLL